MNGRTGMKLLNSVVLLAMGLLFATFAMPSGLKADELQGELVCMRECVPQCLLGGGRNGEAGNSAQCERKCMKRCGVSEGATLKDIRRALPAPGDLTGVVAPDFIIICAGAACVCNTADSCNTLIAECPGEFVLQCNQFDDIGQPTGCSCIRVE